MSDKFMTFLDKLSYWLALIGVAGAIYIIVNSVG